MVTAMGARKDLKRNECLRDLALLKQFQKGERSLNQHKVKWDLPAAMLAKWSCLEAVGQVCNWAGLSSTWRWEVTCLPQLISLLRIPFGKCFSHGWFPSGSCLHLAPCNVVLGALCLRFSEWTSAACVWGAAGLKLGALWLVNWKGLGRVLEN